MGRFKNSGNGIGTSGNPQQSLEQENFSNKNQETSKEMPNYDKATIDDRKFLEYSLDINSINGKDKAIAYEKGLGYNKTNFQSLKRQIEENINSGKVTPKQIKSTDHGMKYVFEIPVTGPNKKTKTVVAVYQIDKDKTIPRLITNYLK